MDEIKQVNITSENMTPIKKIVWYVSVTCPYCNGECKYVIEEGRFKSKEVVCTADPNCKKTFIIKRK